MKFLTGYRIKTQVIAYQILCLGFIILLQLIIYGGAFYYLILPSNLRNQEIIQYRQISKVGNTFIQSIQQYYYSGLLLDYNNIQTSQQLFHFSQQKKIQYYEPIQNCNSTSINQQCFTLLENQNIGGETDQLIQFTSLLFQIIPLFHGDNAYSEYFVSQPDIGFFSQYNKTSNLEDNQTFQWYNISKNTTVNWTPIYRYQNQLIITFFLLIQDNIFLGKHLSVQKYNIIDSLNTLNYSHMSIQLISSDGQIVQGQQDQNDIIYIQNTSLTGFNEQTLQILLQYNKNPQETNLNQCETFQLFNRQLCLVNNKDEKYIAFIKPIVSNNLLMLFTLKTSDIDAYQQMYQNAFQEEIFILIKIYSACYTVVILICLLSSLILASTLNKSIRNLQQFASNYVKCPSYHYKNQLINMFIFRNKPQSNCIHQLNRAFEKLIIMDSKISKSNKRTIQINSGAQYLRDETLYRKYHLQIIQKPIRHLWD